MIRQVVVCGLELLLVEVARVVVAVGVHGTIGVITCLLLDDRRWSAALLFQRAAETGTWAGRGLWLQGQVVGLDGPCAWRESKGNISDEWISSFQFFSCDRDPKYKLL